MGVNMPSLYAAFGNKEMLFRKALQRYLQRPASYLPKALKAPTARGAGRAVIPRRDRSGHEFSLS